MSYSKHTDILKNDQTNQNFIKKMPKLQIKLSSQTLNHYRNLENKINAQNIKRSQSSAKKIVEDNLIGLKLGQKMKNKPKKIQLFYRAAQNEQQSQQNQQEQGQKKEFEDWQKQMMKRIYQNQKYVIELRDDKQEKRPRVVSSYEKVSLNPIKKVQSIPLLNMPHSSLKKAKQRQKILEYQTSPKKIIHIKPPQIVSNLQYRTWNHFYKKKSYLNRLIDRNDPEQNELTLKKLAATNIQNQQLIKNVQNNQILKKKQLKRQSKLQNYKQNIKMNQIFQPKGQQISRWETPNQEQN